MDMGKPVILLNLDDLYESLYDALNQYFSWILGLVHTESRLLSMTSSGEKVVFVAVSCEVYVSLTTIFIPQILCCLVLMSNSGCLCILGNGAMLIYPMVLYHSASFTYKKHDQLICTS